MSTVTLALTSTTVTSTGSAMSVTASVTNSATVPARIVLGVFPAPAATSSTPPAAGPAAPGAASAGTPPPAATTSDPRSWTQVERPLRVVAPGTTEQFTVTLNPPAGIPAGEHVVRFIAYDADRPPEEYSDQAQHLTVVVPATAAPVDTGIPWWVWVGAAVLVLVIGAVAWWVLRPAQEPPLPTPPPATATPSPTPSNPCPDPYVPRLTRPGDLTCVTTLSAAEAKADNDPELQKLRKDPTGAHGPESCVQGYVWRVAYADDLVCVSGATRTRTYWENQGHPLGTP